MKRAILALLVAATVSVSATTVLGGQAQLLGTSNHDAQVQVSPVAYRGYYRRAYRPYYGYRPYGVARPYYGYPGYGYGYGGYGYGYRPGVSVWF